MEASLHEIDGASATAPGGLFDRLNLRDAVAPVETAAFYTAVGGALPAPVTIPKGLKAAEAAVIAALPSDRKALRGWFAELGTIHRALHDVEQMSSRAPSVLLGLLFSGALFRLAIDARQTVSRAFLRHFGRSEAPKFALGGPLAYFDDDPGQLSLLLYAGIWSRYVEEGGHYIRGGSAALTRALLRPVREAGGEAIHGATVTAILTDAGGRAAGVVWRDGAGVGHEARAPIILGGAAPADLERMLPETLRPGFTRAFARFEPSISLFSLSLGLSEPGSAVGLRGYSTFIYPDDMRRYADYPAFAARFGMEPGPAVPPYVIADYGQIETGLRRDGDPWLATLTGVDKLEWWAGLDEAHEMARRRAWTEALIADADRRFPGLAGKIVSAEIATARTMANRLGTPGGSVYGFRPTPSRLFGRPPSPATPVPGLWLASAWTVSGGFVGAMQGGVMAADAALRVRGRG